MIARLRFLDLASSLGKVHCLSLYLLFSMQILVSLEILGLCLMSGMIWT